MDINSAAYLFEIFYWMLGFILVLGLSTGLITFLFRNNPNLIRKASVGNSYSYELHLKAVGMSIGLASIIIAICFITYYF